MTKTGVITVVVTVAALALVGVIALLVSQSIDAAPRNLGGPVAIVEGGPPPKHGFLGIAFQGEAAPLVVDIVFKESGAAEAGVRPGDVVLAIGTAPNPDFATVREV